MAHFATHQGDDDERLKKDGTAAARTVMRDLQDALTAAGIRTSSVSARRRASDP